MDEDEERQFIESLTLRVWKARTEGAIIGAAFVVGIGFQLYLVVYAGPLNPMSVFYEFGLFTIFVDPIRDFRVSVTGDAVSLQVPGPSTLGLLGAGLLGLGVRWHRRPNSA